MLYNTVQCVRYVTSKCTERTKRFFNFLDFQSIDFNIAKLQKRPLLYGKKSLLDENTYLLTASFCIADFLFVKIFARKICGSTLQKKYWYKGTHFQYIQVLKIHVILLGFFFIFKVLFNSYRY